MDATLLNEVLVYLLLKYVYIVSKDCKKNVLWMHRNAFRSVGLYELIVRND